MKDGCDMLIFSYTECIGHRTLNALAGDTNEKCFAVIESGGDKGVDKPLSIS